MQSTHSVSYRSYSSYSQMQQQGTSNKAEQAPANTKDSAVEKTEKSSSVDRASQFDIDALVDVVWGFAANRLAQAEAQGASESEMDALWQAAEKGVQQGFGEAKSILEGMGELDEALELKVDSAFGQIMDKLAERDLSQKSKNNLELKTPTEVADASKSLDRSISLYQYERQTFALNLTTEQGDKILIRSVAEQSATVEDQRFGRLSSSQWGTSQASGFSLVIKGDLNDQEAKDLDALLSQVNELANEFYNGDLETAFNMAKDLNIDGTSLSSMDLSMQEVEAKGASVYAETAGQSNQLPKGLAPLQAYAEKLIAAQEKWQNRFNAGPEFIQALSNHPLNKGSQEQAASWMLS